MDILHVYGQSIWHDEVRIIGTLTALTALRDAIDAAVSSGEDQVSASMFVRDGEGYSVRISARSAESIGSEQLPYSDPIAAGNR